MDGWEPLVIGRPAAPVPARAPAVPPYRPDVVADGWSSPHFEVRCASVRGAAHRFRGEPRQDEFAVVPHTSGALVAVVADGLSAAPMSHLGATMACRTVVEYLLRALDHQPDRRHRLAGPAALRRLVAGRVRPRQLPPGAQPAEPDPRAAERSLAAHHGGRGAGPPRPARPRHRHAGAGRRSAAWVLGGGQWQPVFPPSPDAQVLPDGVAALPRVPADVAPVEVCTSATATCWCWAPTASPTRSPTAWPTAVRPVRCSPVRSPARRRCCAWPGCSTSTARRTTTTAPCSAYGRRRPPDRGRPGRARPAGPDRNRRPGDGARPGAAPRAGLQGVRAAVRGRRRRGDAGPVHQAGGRGRRGGPVLAAGPGGVAGDRGPQGRRRARLPHAAVPTRTGCGCPCHAARPPFSPRSSTCSTTRSTWTPGAGGDRPAAPGTAPGHRRGAGSLPPHGHRRRRPLPEQPVVQPGGPAARLLHRLRRDAAGRGLRAGPGGAAGVARARHAPTTPATRPSNWPRPPPTPTSWGCSPFACSPATSTRATRPRCGTCRDRCGTWPRGASPSSRTSGYGPPAGSPGLDTALKKLTPQGAVRGRPEPRPWTTRRPAPPRPAARPAARLAPAGPGRNRRWRVGLPGRPSVQVGPAWWVGGIVAAVVAVLVGLMQDGPSEPVSTPAFPVTLPTPFNGLPPGGALPRHECPACRMCPLFRCSRQPAARIRRRPSACCCQRTGPARG